MTPHFDQPVPAPTVVAAPRPAAAVLKRRVVALLLAVACGAVLGLAAYLTPSAGGQGTHTQIGLPPCNWVVNFDLPCATCGMTTAFSHAARGDLLASFKAQPLGFILAMTTAATFLVSLYVLATGSAVAGMFGRLWSARLAWVIVGLIAAAWGYKILAYKGML